MTAVLFVDHAPSLGGAEHSLLLLLTHLDRDRWQPHLAGTAGPLLEQAEAVGIPTHPAHLPRLRRSPYFPLDWWGHAGALAHLAQRIPAGALYANTVRAALYTAVAARRARLPFIWHMRDFWLSESRPRFRWLDSLLKRFLCAAAARVIANSRAVAGHLPCPGKVRVVHNGIDLTAFNPRRDGTPFRRRHRIPTGIPLVGMVGRLRPWKGQHRFIEMADLVRRQHPNAQFVIVGGSPFGVDDDYPNHLQQMTAERGLHDQLIFTGHLDDVEPALAAMDLFVHPGDPEPFGLVNVEAMAMALPVAAFAHGALPEIVIDGETGRLVPPGDVSALATAVSHLLHHPEERRQLGAAGRACAVARFGIHRVAGEIDALLDDILDKS